jgi:branched-subunit amino acid transport protein
MVVMAAIVASLFYVPAAVLAALVAQIFTVPLGALVTFWGTFNMFFGLVAWWLAAFAGACAYAAFAFPWKEQVFAWPRKS